MAKKKETTSTTPRVSYNGATWELKAKAGRTLKIEKDGLTIHVLDSAVKATNQAARDVLEKE